MPPSRWNSVSPRSKPSLTARIMSVSSFSTGRRRMWSKSGGASSESKSATSSDGMMPLARQVRHPPSAAITVSVSRMGTGRP